jgi:hypothetical protein
MAPQSAAQKQMPLILRENTLLFYRSGRQPGNAKVELKS